MALGKGSHPTCPAWSCSTTGASPAVQCTRKTPSRAQRRGRRTTRRPPCRRRSASQASSTPGRSMTAAGCLRRVHPRAALQCTRQQRARASTRAPPKRATRAARASPRCSWPPRRRTCRSPGTFGRWHTRRSWSRASHARPCRRTRPPRRACPRSHPSGRRPPTRPSGRNRIRRTHEGRSHARPACSFPHQRTKA